MFVIFQKDVPDFAEKVMNWAVEDGYEREALMKSVSQRLQAPKKAPARPRNRNLGYEE